MPSKQVLRHVAVWIPDHIRDATEVLVTVLAAVSRAVGESRAPEIRGMAVDEDEVAAGFVVARGESVRSGGGKGPILVVDAAAVRDGFQGRTEGRIEQEHDGAGAWH